MTPGFRVTARARRDIKDIGRFTKRTWGSSQTARYLAEIDRRMRWLAEDPRRGRPRPEISPSYFSYPQGAHLIFFMIEHDGIAVIGIPHQAMDLHAHFEGADLK